MPLPRPGGGGVCAADEGGFFRNTTSPPRHIQYHKPNAIETARDEIPTNNPTFPVPPHAHTPMLEALGSHRITRIVAPALIVLGLASFIAAGAGTIISYFKFQESGVLVTVPADNVQLQLDPDTPHTIAHRVTGSHVTENRPSVKLPDDINLKLHDPASNTPIALTPTEARYQTYFFGFYSRRDHLAEFNAPTTGVVNLTADGFNTETVFYIGPAQQVFDNTILPSYVVWIVISLAVMFLGAALIILRLANPSMSISAEHSLPRA